MENNIIRFDWAVKRLLRNKANFGVLEGFLSVLLGKHLKIKSLLESESNRDGAMSKQNRVDLLAENEQGELIIVEVQVESQYDYFQRMLFGVSRAVCDYIEAGDKYAKVRKIYSINVVYFDLGQGKDYVYHGTTAFVGLHQKDVLELSQAQKEKFFGEMAGDLFPEYYVLKVNNFNEVAKNDLNEWVSYIKTGRIPDDASAPGLKEASRRWRVDQLSPSEQDAYYAHLNDERSLDSSIETALLEGKVAGKEEGLKEGLEVGLKKGLKKGLEEGRGERNREIARTAKSEGLPVEVIIRLTGLSAEEIETL